MNWRSATVARLVDTLVPTLPTTAVMAAVAADDGGYAVRLSDDCPLDGRFEVGSVTKTFTGVVLASLVGDGVLALDDEVGRWLDAGGSGTIRVSLPSASPSCCDRTDKEISGDGWWHVAALPRCSLIASLADLALGCIACLPHVGGGLVADLADLVIGRGAQGGKIAGPSLDPNGSALGIHRRTLDHETARQFVVSLLFASRNQLLGMEQAFESRSLLSSQFGMVRQPVGRRPPGDVLGNHGRLDAVAIDMNSLRDRPVAVFKNDIGVHAVPVRQAGSDSGGPLVADVADHHLALAAPLGLGRADSHGPDCYCRANPPADPSAALGEILAGDRNPAVRDLNDGVMLVEQVVGRGADQPSGRPGAQFVDGHAGRVEAADIAAVGGLRGDDLALLAAETGIKAAVGVVLLEGSDGQNVE